MAGVWQPYRQWVATSRKQKSKTARDKKVRRRGRVRMVNAPKRLW